MIRTFSDDVLQDVLLRDWQRFDTYREEGILDDWLATNSARHATACLKREVLRKQIDQLKGERIRARNTERTRARYAEVLLDQSARQRKHIAELSEEISKNELRASETRTLLRFIQDAMQKDHSK